MRRKSEVIPIPDIRERNDRPKDKQPKHQAASTVQRQMVQKFVKELNDSTKQSDRSDSAERTATEQVETTAREIIREAAQFSRKAHHRTNAPHTRPGRPQPQSVSPPICEKPTFTELRGEPHPEPTPENASNVQHIKQPGAWTPRKEALPITRSKGQTIRERPAVTQAHDLPPVPQEQARQAFIEKQAQLSQNPSIESIYPSESAAPILPQPPVSEVPVIALERQSVTAGSGKPVPPVQPLAEHPPTIREKPKPTAAPREKSRRDVSIRTRDTEQIACIRNRKNPRKRSNG